ncbi:hypothetical protein [Salmonella phage vB_SalS_TU03]|nr:hypothetical protein [Salmonella phage vB_SalS_TU03]
MEDFKTVYLTHPAGCQVGNQALGYPGFESKLSLTKANFFTAAFYTSAQFGLLHMFTPLLAM